MMLVNSVMVVIVKMRVGPGNIGGDLDHDNHSNDLYWWRAAQL